MPQTAVEACNRSDCGPAIRTTLQPVEAGSLRIVVCQRNRRSFIGELGGNIGGERAFATSAFGVHDHYVSHYIFPENECSNSY
jgi:hypothetical protein